MAADGPHCCYYCDELFWTEPVRADYWDFWKFCSEACLENALERQYMAEQERYL